MNKLINRILLLVAFLTLFSCNNFISDSSVKEFTSGVKGQVFIGPVSPIEKEGILNKVPYEAILEFLDPDNNIIKKIQTDANGKFETELKPGKYTIKPLTISGSGNYPVGINKDIIIKPDEIAFVEINFDSGIR
jgi:hypothetical protein